MTAWRALWPGIAALVAVMGIGRFVYTPILPEMLAADALTLGEAGWVASANFVGYLVGAMAASRVRARGAQVALARAGLVGTVATLAAMAVVDGLPGWSALRFLAGVASACSLVFVSALTLERLVAIGAADRVIWLYSGVGLGIAASAVLTQAVHAAGRPWPDAWMAAAVLAAASSVAAWRAGAGGEADAGRGATAAPTASTAAPAATPSAHPAASTVHPASIGTAPEPPFSRVVLAYGLFGLGYVIHATYLPAMVRAAGYPPSAAAWIWVLVGVAVLPATVAWQRIARRIGVRRAIVACYAFEGATALAPLWVDSIAGAAVAAAGLGASFIPVTGLALPYARGLDPAHGARAIGTMTAAFGLGQIVGPVVAAWLAARHGFGGPSLLSSAVLLAAAALMAARPRLSARGSPS
jgi:MFS family permease